MDIQRGQLHADHRVHAVDALIAALAATILFSAAPAAAQTSVEVSPLRIELKAEPGGTTTQAITVSNTGPQPVRVRATVSDWYLSRDGAPQFAEATDPKYSASTWLRVAPPEIVVDAGKEATVRFTLTVPAGTSAAGYRTGILFEFSPPSGGAAATRGRSVAFRSRIATLIYANVGEPPAALELTDLQIRRTPDQPAQVIAVLKNTSRRTVRTKGTLTVYDKSGAVVSQMVVPDVPVLPESEREIAIVVINPEKPAPPPGEYRVEVKIDVGMPALIVGETTIKVS
jgi:P pilus assembly chaperone PapD